MSDPAILQYEAWQNIINSSDWKYFKDMIDERVQGLNRDMYIAVRDNDINKAMKCQAIIEEWRKVVNRIKQRLKDFEGIVKTEEGG